RSDSTRPLSASLPRSASGATLTTIRGAYADRLAVWPPEICVGRSGAPEQPPVWMATRRSRPATFLAPRTRVSGARMRGIARGIVAVAAVGLVSAAGTTQASAATVKRFTFTGGQQFFAVPDGVTSLHVVAIGGRGGTGAANTTSPGGFGGVATADVKVTPGAILLVNV